MPGRLAAAALLATLLFAAPALAVEDAGRLADSLRRDPVHVDPSERGRLSPRAAGQLRLRIVHHDIGRVRIAIVSDAVKRRAGGLDALANAVSARLQRPGTLLLIAGRNWWLNTSYAPGRIVAAVQRAANSHRSLRSQLLAAVDRIGKADPGPGADPGDPGGSVAATGSKPPEDVTVPAITIPGVQEVAEGAKTGLILAGGALLAAVVAAVAFFSMRALRRRREASEMLADALSDARAEHVAVGEALTDLDLDEEMPTADAEGKACYGRALDLYDRAGQALQRASNPRRARRATELVAAAHAEVDRAKGLLTRGSPEGRR